MQANSSNPGFYKAKSPFHSYVPIIPFPCWRQPLSLISYRNKQKYIDSFFRKCGLPFSLKTMKILSWRCLISTRERFFGWLPWKYKAIPLLNQLSLVTARLFPILRRRQRGCRDIVEAGFTCTSTSVSVRFISQSETAELQSVCVLYVYTLNLPHTKIVSIYTPSGTYLWFMISATNRGSLKDFDSC